MYCSACGKEIEDDAAVCVHCGVGTGQGSPPPSPIGREWDTPVLVLSYVVALSLPIVGWVAAAYQFVNERVVHGIILVVCSTVITLLWISNYEPANGEAGEPVPVSPETTTLSQSSAPEFH